MNIHKSPYSTEEGRRRKKKDGPLIRLARPRRPPLSIGIKWGCIRTIGICYGLDQGFILGGGRKEKDGTTLHKWCGAHQTSNHLPKPNL